MAAVAEDAAYTVRRDGVLVTDKSELEPQCRIAWLGKALDLSRGSIAPLPSSVAAAVLASVRLALRHYTYVQLRKLLGKVGWLGRPGNMMGPFLPGARAWLRWGPRWAWHCPPAVVRGVCEAIAMSGRGWQPDTGLRNGRLGEQWRTGTRVSAPGRGLSRAREGVSQRHDLFDSALLHWRSFTWHFHALRPAPCTDTQLPAHISVQLLLAATVGTGGGWGGGRGQQLAPTCRPPPRAGAMQRGDSFAPPQAPLRLRSSGTTRPHVPENKCKTGAARARPAGQGLETNRHCGRVVGAR